MKIVIANKSHAQYAEIICTTIKESAKVRGTVLPAEPRNISLVKWKRVMLSLP